MNKDLIFADGFFYQEKEISGKNGKFTITNIGIDADKAIEFIMKHRNSKGFVNLIKKVSQNNKSYLILNQYKKEDNDKPLF